MGAVTRLITEQTQRQLLTIALIHTPAADSTPIVGLSNRLAPCRLLGTVCSDQQLAAVYSNRYAVSYGQEWREWLSKSCNNGFRFQAEVWTAASNRGKASGTRSSSFTYVWYEVINALRFRLPVPQFPPYAFMTYCSTKTSSEYCELVNVRTYILVVYSLSYRPRL
jgi:hypothetical protein